MTATTGASCVGIMEGAFFVSRGELLAWLSKDFQLNLTGVEMCASGAVYIQIMDAIFPGKVPMHKVNWLAKHQWEYTKNYKILQQVFNECGIEKPIEVDKLVKAKPQDNLEFLQWMKAYFDRTFNHQEYAAYERRQCSGHHLPSWATPLSSLNSEKENKHRNAAAAPRPHHNVRPRTPGLGSVNKREATGGGGSSTTTSSSKQVEKLKEEVALLKTEMETVERERDFYFGKLRQIEILTQSDENKVLSRDELQAILYAEEEDEKKAAAKEEDEKKAPVKEESEVAVVVE
eukprot:Platyproteum_vivax@DN16313_c0_g1_i1.p1